MLCIDNDAASGVSENRAAQCRLIGPRPAPLVAHGRWVMIAAIAFSTILTLAGQPASFWRDPSTAIRGDALPVHATLNHAFEFFLSDGALPFLAANLLYMLVAFLLVSRLPRTLASLAIFTAIFAHGYGATNWLVVRFHFGLGGGIATCGVLLGVLLSFAILPTMPQPRAVVNAWRWIMVAVLFVDFTNTLLGQPASYWHDPAPMHEGNSLTRMFLGRGWAYFLGLDLALAAGQFVLATILPLPVAFVTVFALIFGSFVGATNWFFYVWHLGWGAVVGYAAILSAVIVLFTLRVSKARTPNPAQ